MEQAVMVTAMRKFADSKANQKTNERAIKSAVNGDMRGLLDWWYKFIAKYPQYSHATDNQLPDQELLNEIQSVAMESDIRQRQIATNSELIAYAALVYATKTGIELNKQLNAYFKKVAKSTVNKIKSLYPKASKGDIQALVDGVIADVNWSDRIWSNMDELQYDVSRIMKQALLTHTNPVDAVAEIRKRYNVLDYQARRLLRTESARIMAEESIRASKEAGYNKLRWVANTGACRICAPLDGRVFSYREADGMIPRHPNCLCSWVGVDE
ncbi:minor capsid protein [Lactiplantibacillus plantarum]|uniref:minor capsid protein n=1 Tax=Lactiplantibacillus plantarum TaxID=1590 RepID=UPI00155924CB|nr:minor capsid protein [Lactiplantibacillus plantarum]QRG93736.1 minor capsid protein [Lactiplantibacillus plantarum]QRG93777.1 minor capsid protein [Lactiplantibacillus plantarum]BEI64678.1 phage Mu protein [Lactiplantibacillus plantarum]